MTTLDPKTDTPQTAAGETPEPGDELQYLLTAYLFESLSPAGREEVEAELARNPAARVLLEDLRATLGMLEEAFDADRRRYEFEHRRRMRVMQTAVRSTQGGFGVLGRWRFNWKLWSVAAMLMVVVMGFALISPMGSNSQARRTVYAEAPALKTEEAIAGFDSANDVYRRTDHDSNGVLEYKKSEVAFDPVPSYGSVYDPAQSKPAESAPVVPHEEMEVAQPEAEGQSVPARRWEERRQRGERALKNELDLGKDVAQKRLEGGAKAPALGDKQFGYGMSFDMPSANAPAPKQPVHGGRYSKTDIAEAEKKAAQGIAPANGGGQGRIAQNPATSSGEVTSSSGGTSSGDGLFPGGDGQRFDDGLVWEDIPRNAPETRAGERVDSTLGNQYGPNAKLREMNERARDERTVPSADAPAPATEPAPTPSVPFPGFTTGPDQIGKSSVRPGHAKEKPATPPVDLAFITKGKETKSAKVLGESKSMTEADTNAPEDVRRDQQHIRIREWVNDGEGEPKITDQIEQVTEDDENRITRIGRKYQEIVASEIMDYQINPWWPQEGRNDSSNTVAAIEAMKKVIRTEKTLRAYRHYRAGNPQLDPAAFLKHPMPVPPPLITDEGLDEDAFIEKYGTRPFVDARRDAQSTFAMDVDTASYTLARAALMAHRLPDPATVRVEEFVNRFKQDYHCPGDEAFGVFAEGGPAAFGGHPDLELLKVGIKSRAPRPDERKPAMLTLVIDTSGSMADDARLAQVRDALKGLVRELKDDDAVCIVTFAATAELTLPRTSARLKHRILDALDGVRPHGASNVEAGLALGYRMADEAYDGRAVNRVLLCSDGVANVGPQGPGEILKRVKVYAARGIDLISIGFGAGRYNDKMMERLSNEGNGRCFFVDSAAEAERVFKEQMPAHLDVLARDAKVQVEFNPEVVERYRLLGYENRKIADKDFRNDAIDAGEVAHDTLVTALYEIRRRPGAHGALGKVYLRWKDATLPQRPVVERNYPLPEGVMASEPSPDLRFLACVAEFAELLRDSRWARDGSYARVLAELNRLPADFKQRADVRELHGLVLRAQQLSVHYWLHEAEAAPQE